MDNKQVKNDLIKKVLNPYEFPEKVPLYLNLQGWIVYHNAGYEFSEAVYDSDKILHAYEKAVCDFPADIYYDMGGFSSMFFSRCLGSEDYVLNDEKYSLNFKDICYLDSSEEYTELIQNPKNFLWNKFYTRKFKNLAPHTAKETLRQYLNYAASHSEKTAATKKRIIENSGAFFLSDVPMYQSAFDYLFQYIVGIKGISMDMRRNKRKLTESLDILEDLFNHYMDQFTPVLDSRSTPFQMQMCMLGQTITNKKQFEHFIWRHVSKKIDTFIEHDLKFYFMVEGAAGPLLDFLDYIPEGLCALHVERDCIDDLKERYGNKFIYVGGMPVSVLGKASLGDCRSYATNILEKYGHDGNFIFSTDKGISYEADATVDNLKMLCETVNSFKM